MSARTMVGLVACSGSKLDRPAAARDLYTSQLFRKASTYAERTCDRWFILSAEHGLVRPDSVLAPYDTRLTGRTAPVWGDRVRTQLAHELSDVPGVTLVALAGTNYQQVLRPCQWPFQIPMKGLGIGQQLGWLTAQLRGLS